MALNKDEILDAIANLTVIELKDLLDAFEEKFGVSSSPAPVPRRSRSSRSCAS